MKTFDRYILTLFVVVLCAHYLHLIPAAVDSPLLALLSIVGTLPVLVSAFSSLRQRTISVDLLASIALVASLLTHEWASAVFINLMLTSARLFGYYTESKARAAIQSLLTLRPELVHVQRNGVLTKIPMEQVVVGDRVVVELGDRVAVDGIVAEGEASIDQSSLTGESMPVMKRKGDEVYSSTLAVSGSLVVTTTKVGKDTTLEKIISLVESSQNDKAHIRTAGEIFASWYIGCTLVVSITLFFLFHNLALVLSLLLVACADDIAIGIPLAFLAAMGYAARRGVIIKGGAYLEALSKVTTVVLDKTGTITQGKLAVESVVPLGGFSREELLVCAGVAAGPSEHPIARSILHYITEQGVAVGEPEAFEEYAGKGTVAKWNGKELVFGRLDLLTERGIILTSTESAVVTDAEKKGLSVSLFAYDAKLIGCIGLADVVRPHAKAAIQKLRQLGVERIVMLTGDNEQVAHKIATEVGIVEYYAGLLPQDKLAHLKKLIVPGRTLAMVGDGVNDAASLALADVGIAMGAIGSDAAIEAADVALMKDSIAEIPETMELGLYTRTIARQDFIIWGVSNVIGIALVFAHVLGPEGAAMYNFVTDFFPLVNSLRLFNLHLKLR